MTNRRRLKKALIKYLSSKTHFEDYVLEICTNLCCKEKDLLLALWNYPGIFQKINEPIGDPNGWWLPSDYSLVKIKWIKRDNKVNI
jgi:hypothetical protein